LQVIVLGETSDTADQAHRALTPLGVPVTPVQSLDDLGLALATADPADLLVVDLEGGLDGARVGEVVRRARFRGRILALVRDFGRPGVGTLMRLPGAECVEAPVPVTRLGDLLQRRVAESRPARRPPAPRAAYEEAATFHGIVGKSAPMREVFSRIEKAASGDVNVCIYGESGTGKELIARAIHYASPRRDRPLVTFDCTAVPEGLAESQLFGHVRGAFTGAVEHREGIFSLADKGTLFMDELCELTLPLQAKLLRVVQNREFTKVGGSKPLRTDVRLVTATNRDLKEAVDSGAFRADLYYRVAVVVVTVPPLRERREDIPLLVDHFLERLALASERRIRGVEPAAMQRLMEMPWPGNVRQLENFLAQAVVMSESETLTERDLFVDEPRSSRLLPGFLALEAGLQLREVERRYILRTLQRTGGNRTEAARALGISVRCLQYKLKAYSRDEPGDGAAPADAPSPSPARMSVNERE
jgi:DNA-binding NtrC family response regulator